jgi:uncharacterized protein YifN (PemK superfamily)
MGNSLFGGCGTAADVDTRSRHNLYQPVSAGSFGATTSARTVVSQASSPDNRPTTHRVDPVTPAAPKPVASRTDVAQSCASEPAVDFASIILRWRPTTVKEPFPDTLRAVPLDTTYCSDTEYYRRFIPWILEDARASVAQGLEKASQSFLVSLDQGVRLPPTHGNPWSVWSINLRGRIPPDQEHGHSMMVILLSHSCDAEVVLWLIASKSFDDSEVITAKFICDSNVFKRKPSLFKRGQSWKATYITALVSHQRMYQACLARAKPACLSEVITGNIAEAPVQQHDESVTLYTKNLNASQQGAIQRFLATPDGLTLLQGPPGTGKTTTIVQMLAALVAKGQRVLVCAPSNKAVQLLAERFIAKYTARTILVGVEAKVPDVLRPILLHTWRRDIQSLLHDKAVAAGVKMGEAAFQWYYSFVKEYSHRRETYRHFFPGHLL